MLEEIEQYALINNIPIMQKDGIDFLTQFIKENNVKKVLEIGSAIGYSAIKMALVNKEIKVVTIERDINRYNEAIKNISKFNLNEQIEIINIDAFDFDTNEVFDLIFIDAAKAQNIKFFEKFEKNLNKGFIITDNLNFHGLVTDESLIKTRNTRSIVRKIKEYIDYLKNNKQFETDFIDIGDGISISEKIQI